MEMMVGWLEKKSVRRRMAVAQWVENGNLNRKRDQVGETESQRVYERK